MRKSERLSSSRFEVTGLAEEERRVLAEFCLALKCALLVAVPRGLPPQGGEGWPMKEGRGGIGGVESRKRQRPCSGRG